jgi:conjugal transfer pilus assembly protein TraV
MKNGVIRLPACPVPDYRPRRMRLAGVLATAGLMVLSSCTTFGTNINGSFACGAAEGGSCAPATVIDDKALLEITGDTSFQPAGPFTVPAQRAAPQRVAFASSAPAAMSPQKVLRIVFPAHVDALGRFHETSVVQAMVDNGQWLAATNGHGPGLAATSTLNVSPEILSQLGTPIPEQAREVSAAETTPQPAATAVASAPTVGAVAAARAKARTASKPSPAATAQAGGGEPSGSRLASTAPANRPASFNPSVEN